MPNRDEDWTAAEDARLLHMKNVLRLSYRTMGQELGRSRDGMQQRLKRLKNAGTFVRYDAGNARAWPAKLDAAVLDMRFKRGLKYSDIARWLNTQGLILTAKQVKSSIRHRALKLEGKKPPGEHQVRDIRLPYEPGHPTTWGALNSLLPNAGPLHYTPGV